MNTIRAGSALLAFAAMLGTMAWGRAQTVSPTPAAAVESHPAPEPETISVQLLNRIPEVDRSNLKQYWPAVEGRAKDQWLQALPRLAKSLSPGEVRVVCWVHTDGRVTNVALEDRSGNASLDRSALAAVTGSAPFDAFPYGISVSQVRVRFTFNYDEASGGNAGNSTKKPGLGAAPANGGSLKPAGTKPKGPVQ